MNKTDFKELISTIPYPIGSFFSRIPFQYKLGKDYTSTKMLLNDFNNKKTKDKEEVIFKKTKNIVEYAMRNIPFYQDFYNDHNFTLDQLQSFEDLVSIPIITKKDLQVYGINERSISTKGSLMINTGGTSGTPLSFRLDKNAFAREWAYMHEIWSKLNYMPTDLKLTIRGKNLGEKLIKYNPIHNEYIINTYAESQDVINELEHLLVKRKISYIHGYPSAIANFTDQLIREGNDEVLGRLKENLKGVFLGSEYPAEVYRNRIHTVLQVPTISWYGHGEMAILAFEKKEMLHYEPFQTYGYTEAVLNDHNQYRLIGTSYDNISSPFIRYDTGDLIEPISYEGEILTSFKVSEGRVGEFIVDRNGHYISLTALIFGRHHLAFENAKFIQVYQEKKGEATILITKNITADNLEWENEFDFSNVNIDFTYKEISKPKLTKAGKLSLLVKEEDGE